MPRSVHEKTHSSVCRRERLCKRSDYAACYAHGQKFYTPHFVVFILPTERSTTRTGCTVTKKIGCAVVRNRIKRLVREFFRLRADLLPCSADIVLVAKKEAACGLRYRDVETEMVNGIKFRNPGGFQPPES